jgi:hypothetical protein
MKLGKQPARHDPRTLVFSDYRTADAMSVPQEAHWGHGLV